MDAATTELEKPSKPARSLTSCRRITRDADNIAPQDPFRATLGHLAVPKRCPLPHIQKRWGVCMYIYIYIYANLWEGDIQRRARLRPTALNAKARTSQFSEGT